MSTITMNKNPSAASLEWKQASTDVHVATRNGEFAGFVEVHGAVFVTYDSHGNELGLHDTLADARAALAGAPRAKIHRSGAWTYARRRIRRALA